MHPIQHQAPRPEDSPQVMNYQAVGDTIRAGYRDVTPQYRRDDEVEVTTENHRRISATLRRLCASFPQPARALDVGCGTGRYFHCLTNVAELVGLDLTEEMLKAAENPVRAEQITVPRIELVCGNFYLTEFPPKRFDFIYSLGMFGNGCPVTVETCDRFHEWLAPGGILYFNTVDLAGMPLLFRARRQARGLVYPFLPRSARARLDERQNRHPFYGMSRRGLKAILQLSRFRNFEIQSHICQSPLWTGRHLECIATKS